MQARTWTQTWTISKYFFHSHNTYFSYLTLLFTDVEVLIMAVIPVISECCV